MSHGSSYFRDIVIESWCSDFAKAPSVSRRVAVNESWAFIVQRHSE